MSAGLNIFKNQKTAIVLHCIVSTVDYYRPHAWAYKVETGELSEALKMREWQMQEWKKQWR